MRALILTSGGVFAGKILSSWLASGNSVAALWIGKGRFAREDYPLSFGAPLWSVSAMARRHRIPFFRNPKLVTWKDAGAAVRALKADVLITARTAQIVPESVLSQFPGRAVNLHASILPHYRGPHPAIGMILDGQAERYGGVTMHCLSLKIDRGDIIGIRKVPYDSGRDFIFLETCLARAAGELIQSELQNYLTDTLRATPQPAGEGNYRKVQRNELTLSDEYSAAHTKWLCDQFGYDGRLRYRAPRGKALYKVSRFDGSVGPRTGKPAQISTSFIEYDASDARVRIARARRWAAIMRTLLYWLAIVRTRGVVMSVPHHERRKPTH